MSIPALVLEWLELKLRTLTDERTRLREDPSFDSDESDEIFHKIEAYSDVLEKLKGLDS